MTGQDLVRAGVKPLPTSADFRRAGGAPTAAPPRHALAVDTVRFVGEAVAAVVANTREEARDALEAIDVRYDSLPSVVDSTVAAAPDAPQVWKEATGNIAAEIRHGDVAATAKAFAQAAHVVSLDLVNQRLAPCPIEPRALLASYDAASGRITIRASSQTPTGLRDTLCGEVLGIATDKVRVVVGDVGGGFGMKTGLYPEDVVLAYCTRELKRPLKWCAERIDEFLAASHGRDVTSKAELALDASGRVLALRVSSLANLGAYATPAGVVIQLLIGPWVSTSIYDIQTIDIGIKGVLTHTSPTGAYRGAGRPEAIYLIERLMDAAARKLGMDPAEVRRRNMIRPEQMPYKNPMDKTYDSGNFASVMDQARALADWNGFEARRVEASGRRKLRGRGMAAFLEWTGADVFEEQVTVTVAADGYVEIFSATQAMGQGLATTYRPARGRRVRRADREDQDRPGRYRPGDGIRQRGVAFAFRRRIGGAGGGTANGAEGTGSRRRGPRSGSDRHRILGWRLRRCRHRSSDRSLRSRATAAGATDPAGFRAVQSPGRRGRTAATSAKSRSTPRRGTCRSWAIHR